MGTVSAGDVTIAYRASGEPGADPVVLLHGGGSRAATWDHLASALAAGGRRAVALDLRGHGGSSRSGGYPLAGFADDTLAALDALGIGTFAAVGHSLGAHAASLVAQRVPERVTRLVLEDPPVPRRTPGTDRELTGRRLLLPALLLLTGRHGADHRAVTQAIRQLRLPDPGWWAGLAAITAPTLIVGGGPASHIRQDRLAEAAAALPDGRLVTIPAGHRVHSTRPAEFTELVVSFLRQGPPGHRRAG